MANTDICDFFNSVRRPGCTRIASNLWMDVRKQLKFLSKHIPVYFHPNGNRFELLFQPPGRQAPIRCDAGGIKHLIRHLRSALRRSHAANWRSEFPAQGVVADCLEQSPDSNSFLQSGEHMRFCDYRFIFAARLNVLPTRARRRDGGDKRCRLCNDANYFETLPHILSHCPAHNARRTSRHNAILDRLVAHVRSSKNKTLQIRRDQRIPWIDSRNRPDLVIINDKTKEVSIVHVVVPFESSSFISQHL